VVGPRQITAIPLAHYMLQCKRERKRGCLTNASYPTTLEAHPPGEPILRLHRTSPGAFESFSSVQYDPSRPPLRATRLKPGG
jgi:hypothetical protein